MTEALDEERADPDYGAILERLQSRGRFGIRLGLGRTRAILRRLGDPQQQLRGVLIGGTNGKGSTQALVATALTHAGLRVGQTPKPHLSSYRERILVDGRPISMRDFRLVLGETLAAADVIAGRHGQPTEFEVLTAAAFAHFARSGVQVGVIEVGLGGRLDATNAWQGGVSAITNVALDHMEHLGPTIELIAREKSHIIKRGDVVALTGADQPGLGVIGRRARRVGVPVRVVAPLGVLGMDLGGLRVRSPRGEELRVGLLGRHQAANAAVAWAILDALGEAGIATAADVVRHAAFADTIWPGRLELVRAPGTPDVLLDGAHNPHGVAALAAALEELLPLLGSSPPVLLMGVLENHWQPGMLDPLRAAAGGAQLIATGVPNAPNALDPARLAMEWGARGRAVDSADEGLDAALEQAARTSAAVVVLGSLYLVGYLRARLIDARAAG